MNIIRFLFLSFLFSISFSCFGQEQIQIPTTEIRAVWLTTNWNLDWPSSPFFAETQKSELINILDKLQQSNINTILLQVRIRGDVFYKSNTEPYSPYFIKKTNNASYDPLSFAIEECHKRGLELHAWIVTFPVGSPKQVAAQGSSAVVKRHPQLCKLHQGEWYLDPGNPQARQYILSIVDEIVANYDIDGIHFDYIRYPENAKKFPDSDTFRKYGKGYTLDSWRRNNINLLVSSAYSLIKKRKPWVQVSCSPLGKYRSLDPMKGTWTAYESVHQDAAKWMQDGTMDTIYPMMYYNDVNFDSYVKDWERQSNGRFVVPGLGAYRLMSNEGNWSLDDILSQITFLRENKTNGFAFYRAGNIISNIKNINNTLVNNYFKYPAKLPAMVWLKNSPPPPPINIQVYRKGIYTVIEWDSVDQEQQTFTVYESPSNNIDINDARSIVMTRINGNSIFLKTRDEERGVYFTVTASDRYHNESAPSPSAFYVLSSTLEK